MKKKYTYRNILIILLILTFAYLYAIAFAPLIENINDDSFFGKIANLNKSCFYNCSSKKCKKIIKINRGRQYFISIPESEQEHISGCIVTFWSFTHFIMYFILTLLVPSFYIEFFFLGIVFEIYEHYHFNCQDVGDIYFNTLGIVLGKYLSPFE